MQRPHNTPLSSEAYGKACYRYAVGRQVWVLVDSFPPTTGRDHDEGLCAVLAPSEKNDADERFLAALSTHDHEMAVPASQVVVDSDSVFSTEFHLNYRPCSSPKVLFILSVSSQMVRLYTLSAALCTVSVAQVVVERSFGVPFLLGRVIL